MAPSAALPVAPNELLVWIDIQSDRRHYRLAILDLHPITRLRRIGRSHTFQRLLRIDRDLNICAETDILVGDALWDHGHLALVDGDVAGLRLEPPGALVLEAELVATHVAMPTALLAIASCDFDDDIVVRIENERQEAIHHIDAGRNLSIVDDRIERDLLHLASETSRAFLEKLFIAINDEALVGAVAPLVDGGSPKGVELLNDLAHGMLLD